MRLTGIATGLDTDTLIKQMLKPYQMRLDKTGQDKQILQWQQETYKDIIKDVNDLKSKYFDILKKDNYLLSSNSYYGVNTTVNDKLANLANIVAASSAKEGKYKLEVTSIAKNAKITSDNKVQKKVDKIEGTELSSIGIDAGSVLKIRYKEAGGQEVTKEIKIDSGNTTIEQLQTKINDETDENVTLKIENGSIKLDGAINFEDSTGIMDKLNSNMKIGLGTKLSDLGIVEGDTFTIDYTGIEKPIEIKVEKGMVNLHSLMQEVEKKTNGEVKLSFNELTEKISFETKSAGSDIKLKLTNRANDILGKLGITTTFEGKGQDAEVNITEPDGTIATKVVKNTNKFTINGVTYDLKEASDKEVMEFTITKDTQKGVDLIKGFIEDYNKLVEKTNKLTTAKKNYNYSPLTDDQKKEMTEDEIKRWEEKAKEGIIKGDPNIERMMRELRNVFFQKVEGNDTSLQSIGINTTKNYLDGGKLAIDEEKLKKAFAEDPEKVIELFTKESTTHSSYNVDATSEEREVRNKEQGILRRIEDIFKDYARTSPNKDGKRGILLDKAGLEGTYTELNNELSKKIRDKDKIIYDQTRKLAERENKLYIQFAQLEKAMNSLNSQQAWFTQQMGGQ
ncbi:flagellar filament capping protein FliD [Clostridium sp. UBA6640]|uniref:flagellar filament capping protein FliD n=1 Tax=Clostridium sp. UBA6640 TaxID=1946370 RepID=UPI0025C52587|nr:flagellar filament capping protein FliD [Clostridium sp. UBA6640]